MLASFNVSDVFKWNFILSTGERTKYGVCHGQPIHSIEGIVAKIHIHESLGVLKGLEMFDKMGVRLLNVGLTFGADFKEVLLLEGERLVGVVADVEYDQKYKRCLF